MTGRHKTFHAIDFDAIDFCGRGGKAEFLPRTVSRNQIDQRLVCAIPDKTITRRYNDPKQPRKDIGEAATHFLMKHPLVAVFNGGLVCGMPESL